MNQKLRKIIKIIIVLILNYLVLSHVSSNFVVDEDVKIQLSVILTCIYIVLDIIIPTYRIK
jgi:hypothetical protein